MTQDFGVHATQDMEAGSPHQMKRLEIRICRARRAESQDGGATFGGGNMSGRGCGGTELGERPTEPDLAFRQRPSGKFPEVGSGLE